MYFFQNYWWFVTSQRKCSKFTWKYESIDHVGTLVQMFGKGSLVAKVVVDVAFCIMCLDEYHFAWFIFDDKICYDKILSIWCSPSCQIFKKFSKAIKWLLLNHFKVSGYTHILHDFIFVDSCWFMLSLIYVDMGLNHFLNWHFWDIKQCCPPLVLWFTVWKSTPSILN